MKTIRINRKMWACNPLSWPSKLYDNRTNRGCCLGHVIHQTSKCSWKELNDLREPNDFFVKCNNDLVTTDTDGVYNSKLSTDAMEINDSCKFTTSEKEYKLKNLFAEHGINLEFYGEL